MRSNFNLVYKKSILIRSVIDLDGLVISSFVTVEGLRVPVMPIVKPSGVSTPRGPPLAVRSRRDQSELNQPSKTSTSE